jgi:hypothetical protein
VYLKIDHLLYATGYNFSYAIGLLRFFLSFVFCFPPCGLLETFYYNTLTQFCMDNLSYFLSSSQPDPRPSSTFSHHHARAERLLTVSASRRCALSLCATWMEELAGAPSLIPTIRPLSFYMRASSTVRGRASRPAIRPRRDVRKLRDG